MGESIESTNAFERVIKRIRNDGVYHPRDQRVSTQLGLEILRDLYFVSPEFREDVNCGRICYGFNLKFEKTSTSNSKRTDLAIGVLDESADIPPILTKYLEDAPLIPEMKMLHITTRDRDLMKEVRIAMENKSVITAHRNRNNRSDELVSIADVLSEACPGAILVATVMIGTATEFLNYEVLQRAEGVLEVFCERVRGGYQLDEIKRLLGRSAPEIADFLNQPRIRKALISTNESQEPFNTMDRMHGVLKPRENTSQIGYDVLILQFCHIDNIGPARLESPEYFKGIYAQYQYNTALKRLSGLYRERFAKSNGSIV